MTRDTLIGLRPRDDSATAIRASIAAISREIEGAEARRLAAVANRQTSLSDPRATTRDVIAFEALSDRPSRRNVRQACARRSTATGRASQMPSHGSRRGFRTISMRRTWSQTWSNSSVKSTPRALRWSGL